MKRLIYPRAVVPEEPTSAVEAAQERPAMRTIGIDLGKVNSQLSERDENGQELRNERFPTTRQTLSGLFENQPESRILVEAGPITHWVAQFLRELGHQVVFADPNYLPMYIDQKSKRKKTDKRDASLLSLALLKGNWRAAHERSEPEQLRKILVDARARQVKARTQTVNGIRSTFAYYGIAMPKCEPEALGQSAPVPVEKLPERLHSVMNAQLKGLRVLNRIIAGMDKQLVKDAKTDARIKRLTTVPGVGPVIAAAFVATIDEPNRFGDGHELASFLGLCPSESSSGENKVRGHITKAGPKMLRALLVQAAWGIWRSKEPEAARLKGWAKKIFQRRKSKRLAAVALARKLAGVLLAMWKNEKDFDPKWNLAPALKVAA
jgi:transposase